MSFEKNMSAEEVALIASKDDFHIAPYRENGKPGTLTWIWVVEVEGKLYVRAYNGINSGWYNSAMKQGSGIITGAGLKKEVRFIPVGGEYLSKIDDAYRSKYAGSPYLNAMVSERSKAATVAVLPLD